MGVVPLLYILKQAGALLNEYGLTCDTVYVISGTCGPHRQISHKEAFPLVWCVEWADDHFAHSGFDVNDAFVTEMCAKKRFLHFLLSAPDL